MTGRRQEAEALAWVLADVHELTRAMDRSIPSRGESELHRIADAVGDPNVPAGMRWEFFGVVNALTPCASLHRIVYGPDEDHADWMARARASLVHHAGRRAAVPALPAGNPARRMFPRYAVHRHVPGNVRSPLASTPVPWQNTVDSFPG